MFFILLTLTAATLFYVWLKWNYSYWKRNDVPGPEPTLIIGNIGPTLNFTKHWGIITSEWYKEYVNEPFVGYFKMMKPAILLKDLDLIKDVLIKDFDHFRKNDFDLSDKLDPLLATTPFFAEDSKWKDSRRTLIPAFSPNKIKYVLPVMNGVGEQLVKFIKMHSADEKFDAKNLAVRFTTEIVIRCTFSTGGDCLDREDKSEFLECGRRLFAPSFLTSFKFMVMPIFPKWALDLIPVPFIPNTIDQFFRRLVSSNKASRPPNYQNNDILQMLIQTQQKHNITDEKFLPAYVLEFFLEGTETSSTAIAYALYELAANPDVQEKLHSEIVEMLDKHDGNVTAEGLQELVYLEAVLFEAMRKHPPLLVMQKVCTKDYELPKNKHQSKPVTIRPGTFVNIPVQAIHMDPKNYPDPEKFEPERFFPEERRNRHKAAFLGFGEGPRVCIGIRFAIAQIKVALAYIVRDFHIKLSPNQKPIIIDPQSFLSLPKDGIHIQFGLR